MAGERQLVDARRRRLGHRALAALFVADFMPNYAEYQLAPLAGQVMRAYGIDKVAFSALFTAPLLMATPLALVASALVDRRDPRRLMLAVLSVSAAGALVAWLAPTYPVLWLGFALMGCCLPFVVPTCVTVAAEYLGPGSVGLAVGLMFAAASLSQALATATSGLMPSLGVAHGVSLALYVAALAAFALLFRTPEGMGDGRGRGAGRAGGLAGFGASARSLVGERGFRALLVCLFLDMGVFVLVSSLVPTALAEMGVPAVEAGAYAALFTLGNLAGCFLVPALAGRVVGLRASVAALAVPGALAVALIRQAPAGPAVAMVLALAGMLVGGLKPLLVSLAPRTGVARQGRGGMATSLAGMVQSLGAVVLPTYLVLPLAGGDLGLSYLVGAGCVLACAALAPLLPE